jgi:hypothetical protein
LFGAGDVVPAMTALLACRLAVHLGSYVPLVRDMVASHMMIPLALADDGGQVQATFPPEPLLAAAASSITAELGWLRPLETLISLIQHGVVDKGFRGELITKVVLCMAMEAALAERSFEDCLPFTRPVPVLVFIRALLNIEGSDNHSERRDDADMATRIRGYLMPQVNRYNLRQRGGLGGGKPPAKWVKVSKPDPETILKKALARIEEGSVFFNHFITTDGKLTPSLLVQAWNRGAAIATQPGTMGVDFIIPVILPQKNSGDVEPDWGPLFGIWPPEKEETVGVRLSYMCIDAKNVASMTASPTKFSLNKCRPMPENFEQHVPQNPFFSLVMSFGKKSITARHVEIFPLTASEITSRKPIQQLEIFQPKHIHSFETNQNSSISYVNSSTTHWIR